MSSTHSINSVETINRDIAVSQLAISVIVPTYNRAERLRTSLENYLQSDCLDAEFIIVDNHSDDNTSQLVQDLMEKDSRVRYVKNSANIGPNRSIFRGFLDAKAPLIMILPDDDVITKGFISLVVKAFNDNPEVGVVHSALRYSGVDRGQGSDTDSDRKLKKGADAVLFMLMHSGGIPGIAFRKNTIDFDAWNLNDSIYPQVKLSSDIACRHDVYFIASDSEYVNVGRDDNVVEKAKRRPRDYGIHERIDVGFDVIKNLPSSEQLSAFQGFTMGLFMWACSIFVNFYKADRKQAWIYFNALIKHPYIKSSLIFWGMFLKEVVSKAQVRIVDKMSAILKMIWSLFISLFDVNLYKSFYFISSKLIKKIFRKSW